jgi:hypothetical protein
MRFLLVLSLAIIFQACSQKSESSTEPEDSASAGVKEQPAHYAPIQQDSSIFISEVNAFDETSEFYTPVDVLETLSGELPWDELSRSLDSLIYKYGEYGGSRKRLPLKIAKNYFNLGGIDRISIYNIKGHLVTDAVFERVEYLDGEIEGEFIAVYRPMIPAWYTEDVAYCMSAGEHGYQTINPSMREVRNAELSTRLSGMFLTDSAKVQEIKHFEFPHYKGVYSTVVLDRGSYLIETVGDQSTVLYRSKDDETIIEVMPVHLEINGKPVLLITEGVNETDMIWTYLAVHSPTGYQPVIGSRIKRK